MTLLRVLGLAIVATPPLPLSQQNDLSALSVLNTITLLNRSKKRWPKRPKRLPIMLT